jgi:hypothetical protein
MIIPLPAAVFYLTGALWGQDQTPQPRPAPQNQPAAQPTGKAKKKPPSGSSNDRLFFALPNFMTLENSANVPPLTARQKFSLTARGTFDPMQFIFYAAQAGLNQAQDHDEEFGQGAQGFGKRYAIIIADGTLENFMTRAVFPSILRQDPRYFRKGEGGFWRRTLYAIDRLVMTRGDSGDRQFNYSEILGAGSAAAISVYTYHPKSDRGFSNVMQVWAIQVGWDALSNGLKEFWPDMRRRITKSKSGQAGSPPPPTPTDGH